MEHRHYCTLFFSVALEKGVESNGQGQAHSRISFKKAQFPKRPSDMCGTGNHSLFTFLLAWLGQIMESIVVCKRVDEEVGQDASETTAALKSRAHSVFS